MSAQCTVEYKQHANNFVWCTFGSMIRPYSRTPFLNSLKSNFLFPSSSMILKTLRDKKQARRKLSTHSIRCSLQLKLPNGVTSKALLKMAYRPKPFIPDEPRERHCRRRFSTGSFGPLLRALFDFSLNSFSCLAVCAIFVFAHWMWRHPLFCCHGFQKREL